jgi:Kef-type K+ transport system membrane component KefB
MLHVLLAIVAVIVSAQLLGVVFRHLKQPPVIGEVIAGLLLGPTLLGRIAPSVSGYMFPSEVAPIPGVLSQVGVILYMFIVGLEVDTARLRARADFGRDLLLEHPRTVPARRGSGGLALSALLVSGRPVSGVLLGVVIPHDSEFARNIARKIEDVVVVLLPPAFFAFTGLRTQIGLPHCAGWLVCAVIVAVASAGKFGGSTLAARLTGLDWHQSASLGILMNTRGLMDLIVLNVGLDLHVLSPTLFAMLVVMAVVTTLMTAPRLHAVGRPR